MSLLTGLLPSLQVPLRGWNLSSLSKFQARELPVMKMLPILRGSVPTAAPVLLWPGGIISLLSGAVTSQGSHPTVTELLAEQA